MNGDKLLISCIVTDSDVGRLSAMLQTLVDAPPTIPWDVSVIGARGVSERVRDYCLTSHGVKFVESIDEPGIILDSSSDANLRLLVHPDTLFLNKLWCDAIFSKMIDVGAAMIGAAPFTDLRVGEKRIPGVSPWFIAWDEPSLRRVGGFSGASLGPQTWSLGWLRAVRAGMPCVGAEIGGLVAHTGACAEDKAVTEEVRITRSILLAEIAEKEGLLP